MYNEPNSKILNNAEIDELIQKSIDWQKENIKKYREKNDYSALPYEFGNGGLLGFGTLAACDALLMLYDEIPDKQKYQVVFDVYTNLKSPTNDLKKIVLDAAKYRPDKIIAPLKKLTDIHNNLIVYRGAGEKEKSPQSSLSWTRKRKIAVFFAKDYFITKAKTDSFYIYTGEININDIIHYTNKRNEFEVIQYRSVKNIREECINI